MRKERNRKEKWARVGKAKAAGDKPARKGGKAPSYDEWAKADLYDRAKEIGIDGRSRMSKSDLVSALRNH